MDERLSELTISYDDGMKSTQLYELLKERGIDPSAQPVTLMRHKTGDYPLHKFLGTKALTLYQAMQLRRHEPGGLIVAFYGHRPDHGILLGIWRIKAVIPGAAAFHGGLLEGSFELTDQVPGGFYHDLEELQHLSDLRMKLEIRWGGRPNSWRRILRETNDYTVSIKSEPAVAFSGMNCVSLVMAELRLVLQDVAWQQGLGSVSGVYLITDEHSGKQYVGSAYGGSGVWQRWGHYADSGHGGNQELVKLLQEFPERRHDFRFTLLETLPLETTKREVIARENYWKIALGSRRFGLNRN